MEVRAKFRRTILATALSVLGMVGFVATALLVSGHHLGAGFGGMERIAAYPLPIGLIMVGLLLAAARPGPGRPRTKPTETRMTEVIGFIAAACTTFAFVPQAIRVWRTHSVEDISLAMYLILVVGITMWIAYGVFIHSMPVLVANSVTLVLAGAVLVGKLKFMNQDAPNTRAQDRHVGT